MTAVKLPRSLQHLFSALALASLALGPLPAGAKVVDDFNSTKTGWEDANPANLPFPGGTIVNQQFVFNMPTPGQSYFVSSTKTTETFELKEGRTIEFRVDMVSGLGDSSFAVLAWIPEATGANSLAGYGIAKSQTDILITKGVNKYFSHDVPTPEIKNQNVTLVLSVKAKGGNVTVTGKVLDKDNNEAVLYEKTFVDTPAADVMAEGADSPVAPFLGNGHFTLYLYANGGTNAEGYQVVLDNAEAFVMENLLLDDFNGTKTGWADANPANLPLPGGTIVNQQFVFNLPKIGQPYFVNSTKTTKTFELVEGTQHEFRLDLVSGQGPDSFAVMAWIPETTGANTLAGYGIAKSETDMLITKGINKYFYNENPTPSLKNNNVTLVLNLTVRNGNVVINGRVLDKDDSNKVIFDKTFVDTPAADVMADGQDSPSAPFLTKGQVVLYLYADGGTDDSGYQVIVDNLEVSAPPAAANVAPIISEVTPLNGANFLAAPAQISFTITDDNALPDAGISVDLGGTNYTTANGLTLSGPTTARKATLGGLASGQNYVAVLSAVDAGGLTTTQTLMFDTFPASLQTIEVEDYNFDSGSYFTNPVLSPTGNGQADNSYTDRVGTEGVDFHDTRTSPSAADTQYRTYDPVRMQASLDLVRAKYTAAGGKDNGYIDYDVGDIATDEWLDYTRNFTSGTYQVYLREAVVGFDQADSRLELVTSDRTQPDQATSVLGTFNGRLSGYSYRNVPLTDASGKPIIVRLSGIKTLRLVQVTADTSSSARYLNYLIFQPVADPGLQRATVASLSPSAGATIETVQPVIEARIQNRDTAVNVSTLGLTLNDQAVSATVTPTAEGATLSYALPSLPASGAVNSARVAFKDDTGTEVTAEWTFTVMYKSLDPANRRSGPGLERGFSVRMVQAPSGSNLENTLDRAENQLAAGSTIPVYVDTNVVLQVINLNEVAGNAAGNFPDDEAVPGLDDLNGTDDYAVEIHAWLQLAAGVYRFGVVTDDGYKISSGAALTDKLPLLGFKSGGTADESFDFVVAQSGFYPFRMLWYERGGGSHAEWFSVNLSTGAKTLLNDPNTATAIKAYLDVAAAPTIQVLSAAVVTGPYTADAGAQVADGKVTLPVPGANRFYRLSISQGTVNITGIALEGQSLVIRYTAQ